MFDARRSTYTVLGKNILTNMLAGIGSVSGFGRFASQRQRLSMGASGIKFGLNTSEDSVLRGVWSGVSRGGRGASRARGPQSSVLRGERGGRGRGEATSTSA